MLQTKPDTKFKILTVITKESS